MTGAGKSIVRPFRAIARVTEGGTPGEGGVRIPQLGAMGALAYLRKFWLKMVAALLIRWFREWTQ